MISTESMVFVFNAVVPPLAWMYNPWYRKQKHQRDEEKAKKHSVLTQKEANE